MELTARQVAEAFEVSPITVNSWVQRRRLAGALPRKARKAGRRFRLSEVRRFAEAADDDGYSEDQLNRWLETHREEVKVVSAPGFSRTPVLSSGA